MGFLWSDIVLSSAEPLYFVCGFLFGLFDAVSLTFSSAVLMKVLPPSVFDGGMSGTV